jgi:hypothetical protein
MPKGNLSKFFPGKLRIMLDKVDELGLAHGSSWVSEGRAFAIHDPDVFMNDIAPQFFDKQTHLRSFHRQLSIWGFTRLETGAGGRGVWFHKHFIRDKPELIKHIKRVPVKNPKPTQATPKNQLPDYTNYQLPMALGDNAAAAAKAGEGLSPVHQPNQMGAGAPGIDMLPAHLKATLPPPAPQGQEGLDYLSALGRLPPGMPQRGYGAPGAQAPLGADPSRSYQNFIMANYAQPPMVGSSSVPGMPGMPGMNMGSMNRLPGIPGNGAQGPNDLGDVAQQLLACRSNAGQGGDNNNLNAAILSMIMDSRRQEGAAPNANAAAANAAAAQAAAATGASSSGTPNASSAGANAAMNLSNQDLLSAIARRNLFNGAAPAAPAPKQS